MHTRPDGRLAGEIVASRPVELVGVFVRSDRRGEESGGVADLFSGKFEAVGDPLGRAFRDRRARVPGQLTPPGEVVAGERVLLPADRTGRSKRVELLLANWRDRWLGKGFERLERASSSRITRVPAAQIAQAPSLRIDQHDDRADK